MLEFTLLNKGAPRLGYLTLPGRSLVTPCFIASTSRGVIPHVTPENFRKLDIGGVHVALEDFVEKHPQKTPPILSYDVPNPLRRFTALPDSTLVVLSPRRNPPITSAVPNSNTEIGILTSVGFRSLASDYYASAARKFAPDIVVGMADIPFGQASVGVKRKDKMSDRTEVWLRDLIAKRKGVGDGWGGGEHRFSIFAPILPVERDLQAWYLEHVLDDMLEDIDGVAVYDAYSVDELPEEMQRLPRLSLDDPKSPHEILRQIGLGVDIFTIPFIASATDAGIALDFEFPPPQTTTITPSSTTHQRQPLGIDMWQPSLAVSVTPLRPNCHCYACTKHHRAYVQHLLCAKEMLGWVLLQLHNHALLTTFFSSIRSSIQVGTFDADIAAFTAYYEGALPEKTGQGPRVRGYQFKAEDHAKADKKNPKAYRRLEDGVVPLKAAHGQQPNARAAVRDVMDDEALLGLIGIEDRAGEVQVSDLSIEDDKS